MKLATIAILVVVGLTLAHGQSISFGGGDRRTTPAPATCKDFANKNGACDLIQKCPAMLNIVRNNPTPQQIRNVRGSICGTRIINFRPTPLICCASEATPPTEPPTQPPTEPPTAPPTVTEAPSAGGFSGEPEQHPNRRLLADPATLQCGTSDFTIKIVGGVVADLGEYPWLAILGYERSGAAELDFNCGGVLINERYVLTAAHCVTNLPAEFQLAKVRLGEHNLTSAPDCVLSKCSGPIQDFDIEEVIPHADYNSPERFWNDIALIRLSRPFDGSINSSIQPICLPFGKFRTEPLDDKKFVVAGFGLTEAFGDSSEVMMKVSVPLFDNGRCGEVFRRQRAKIGPAQMCAGGARGQDSCSGDSGGPLMATTRFGPPHYAVGVVSFGVTRCGTENVPGVYTRVSEYLNWIMDHMRD